MLFKLTGALAGWVSWSEDCPIHQKSAGLNPVQGQNPRLRVWSPVRALEGSN